MADITITPPFGYGEIQALNYSDYVALYEAGEVPAFAGKSQVLPLTFSEFLAAAAHLPIVFIQPAGGNGLMPVVMTGLGGDQSLFARLEGKGKQEKWKWAAQTYLPAYVRRHPFCMSSMNGEAKVGDDLLVCVQKSHVSDQSSKQHVKLFDEANQPTERWQLIEQFLQSYQADIQLTREFTEKLKALDLFYSLEANIRLDDGVEPMTVTGMFGINEEKLNQLDDATIAELNKNGYLPRIYAHLQSMQNFQKLLTRLQGDQVIAAMKKPKQDAELIN